MGQPQDVRPNLIISVSVSALSDHLMGPGLSYAKLGAPDRFSIRSFGSFDGTGRIINEHYESTKFQYPLFRII